MVLSEQLFILGQVSFSQVLFLLIPIPFVDLSLFQSEFIRKLLDYLFIPIGILSIGFQKDMTLILIFPKSISLFLAFGITVVSNDCFDIHA